MIEAILWDNDGVLVDTEGLFFQATQEVLARADVQVSLDFYVDWVMGRGRSTFELASARGWSPDQIARLREERDLEYARLLEGHTRVLAGVREA